MILTPERRAEIEQFAAMSYAIGERGTGQRITELLDEIDRLTIALDRIPGATEAFRKAGGADDIVILAADDYDDMRALAYGRTESV
jgi:hypothetical protein